MAIENLQFFICNLLVLFSVVTPSFRSGSWLKLCLASVADQGLPVEHIIQDAGSDDGTLEWLLTDRRVKAYAEKDEGMYDAINRGLRRAQGEVLAWLNCDEQYLPDALKTVGAWMESHPEVDVLFGDVIMVDPKGDYICHRKMQVPLKYHTWTSHLSTLSCAMFFRRRVIAEHGLFNPKLRDVGDGEWMVRLLRAGVRMAALGRFTSVFTRTGANMSAGPNARREALELRRSAPLWARAVRPGIVLYHRLRRMLGGMHRQEPFGYEIYTMGDAGHRRRFEVASPVGTARILNAKF